MSIVYFTIPTELEFTLRILLSKKNWIEHLDATLFGDWGTSELTVPYTSPNFTPQHFAFNLRAAKNRAIFLCPPVEIRKNLVYWSVRHIFEDTVTGLSCKANQTYDSLSQKVTHCHG